MPKHPFESRAPEAFLVTPKECHPDILVAALALHTLLEPDECLPFATEVWRAVIARTMKNQRAVDRWNIDGLLSLMLRWGVVCPCKDCGGSSPLGAAIGIFHLRRSEMFTEQRARQMKWLFRHRHIKTFTASEAECLDRLGKEG
jgi:hypothetical protein